MSDEPIRLMIDDLQHDEDGISARVRCPRCGYVMLLYVPHFVTVECDCGLQWRLDMTIEAIGSK